MTREANIQQRDRENTTKIILDQNQRSWWNSLSDGQRRFVASLSIILGVSLVGLIAWFFIRRSIKNAQAKKVQNLSFGTDKHATWAKQFKLAFDNDGWWGTDVPLVRTTMRAIPSKEDFTKVQQAYTKMFKGANLVADMSDELTKLEYDEMLAIKNAKPQDAKGATGVKIYDPVGWAKRFHAALDYIWLGFMPGTDEDAIKAVFQEMPNKQAFYNTAVAYKKLYGTSLWEDLDGDLDWSMDWRKLIKKK